MTILVTGARGKVARSVIAMLTAAGETVRAAGRDPSKTPAIEGVPIVGLDLADPASVKAVLDGVDRVFMYAAAEGLDGFLAAARDAGVRHIAMLSSLAAGYPSNPIGDHHLAAENPLRESGIPFTILRPGMFATNVLSWAAEVRGEGVVRIAHPDSHGNPIHEDDMADVAVAALTRDGHAGEIYPLGGPESLTQRRQVELIGEALGREITVEELTEEQALARLPEALRVPVGTVLRMQAGTVGKPVPTGPLSQDVTGIPSRTFAQWAVDHAEDFR